MNKKAIYQIYINGDLIGLYYLPEEQVRVFKFLQLFFELDIEQVNTDEVKEI